MTEAGTRVAVVAAVRRFRRPERVQIRLGNQLPDASGEIDTEVRRLDSPTGEIILVTGLPRPRIRD
jgi:hypothetical protein